MNSISISNKVVTNSINNDGLPHPLVLVSGVDEVILARYCMMIFVASVLPDPLSPLIMMDWFDALAFLSLLSLSASRCPFTCVQAAEQHSTLPKKQRKPRPRLTGALFCDKGAKYEYSYTKPYTSKYVLLIQ